MWLCTVVDTSIGEDREYLEFWYADVIYAIRATDYMYVVQETYFENWLRENAECDCVYVTKQIKENQI